MSARPRRARRPARAAAPAAQTRRRPAVAAEEIARSAVAHEAAGGASRGRVKLPLTLDLDRGLAERLTARAIREGKNLEALVAEILEASASRTAG